MLYVLWNTFIHPSNTSKKHFRNCLNGKPCIKLTIYFQINVGRTQINILVMLTPVMTKCTLNNPIKSYTLYGDTKAGALLHNVFCIYNHV